MSKSGREVLTFAESRRGDWYAVLFLIFCFVLERLILRLEPRTCCF